MLFRCALQYLLHMLYYPPLSIADVSLIYTSTHYTFCARFRAVLYDVYGI